jgi:hypothetical protein
MSQSPYLNLWLVAICKYYTTLEEMLPAFLKVCYNPPYAEKKIGSSKREWCVSDPAPPQADQGRPGTSSGRAIGRSGRLPVPRSRKPRKWSEVAEELNISLDTLKNLTRGELFQQKYDLLMAELGHDPRYKAVQAGMADLLPVALRQLDGLIRTGPPQVKMQAIKFLFETAGVKIKPPDESDDRQKLAEFLQGANITQNNLTITLDPNARPVFNDYQPKPIEEFAETIREPAPQSLD